MRYVPTLEGYRLLHHLSLVYEEVGDFFPRKKGFDRLRRVEVERDLTELWFNLPCQASSLSYAYTAEEQKRSQ